MITPYITFSNINMNNLSNILLSILHSCWCTHKDFRKIFLTEDISVERVFKDILNFSQTYKNIFQNRYEKIYQKLNKIDINTHREYIEQNNIKILSFFEKDYPENLKNINNYPFIFYYKWDININWYSLAVVWSRKNTPYGNAVLEKIFNEIPNINISIVSWWAYGIDSLAHTLALKKNFHTISIFGCWIDITYPSSNKILFEKIIENWWWLISIFPLWTPPDAFNFPIRNEIVAWLSNWVLIPEANIKSWTLITARLALDLWKDIFAIPWDIFRETSNWCNLLIANWEAKCTLSADDIFLNSDNFQQLSIFKENQEKQKNIKSIVFRNDISEKIYTAIQNNHNTVDLLANNTDISINDIMIELAMLELDWYIKTSLTWHYECIY